MNNKDIVEKELQKVTPIVESLGFSVDHKQLHIGGERAVLSHEKLVLMGSDQDNNRVVIKCSRFEEGISEIEHEKKIRDGLLDVSYTDDNIAVPRELYFGEKEGYAFFVTEYISQEKVFVEHDLKKQFFMIMRAFERQESYHATTYEHVGSIKNITQFKEKKYSENLDRFFESVSKYQNSDVQTHVNEGLKFFTDNKDVINTYTGHLIHEDFVPHNFRIRNNQIYMLDYSSLQYGNKYESWARFLNYMIIHNPELEKLLNIHIYKDRGEREYLSLKVMRVYKIFQLLDFYMSILNKVEGNLLKLTKIRIEFWSRIMSNTVNDINLTEGNLKDYKTKRDSLRSLEEKERQREFAVA